MKKVKLSELGEIVGGSTPAIKNIENYDGNISWITPKDLANYNKIFIESGERSITEKGLKSSSTKMLPKNSVLFTSRAPIGYIAIAEKELCTNQGFKSIIPNNNVNYIFLYYLLKYNKEYIASFGSGTTFKEVSGTVMKNIEVNIPDTIEEQKKIANILYSIDKKIELNNQVNNNLEELMKTIYQRWFIEFEFPNEEGKPYKSSGGKLVYNDELKQEIPEGWKVENIMDYINWEGTSQPPKSEFVYEPKGGYIRFIQNRDYDDNSHITFVPKSKVIGICNKYDILMDKYGDAGRTRFGLDGAYNVALAKIIIRNNLYREYIRSFLSSESVYNYLHNSSMASTRASLNENNISFINLTIPPKNLLEKYNKFANNYIESNISLKEENDKLTELKNFLLPLLMNGQINVDDIEI